MRYSRRVSPIKSSTRASPWTHVGAPQSYKALTSGTHQCHDLETNVRVRVRVRVRVSSMERRDGNFIAGDPRLGRIMLKYRPIAPKPTASGAPVSPPETGGKRKGPARDGPRGRKARRVTTQKKVDSEVVTLPLMPMTPERKEVALQIQHDHTQSPTSSSEAHVRRSGILLTESWVTVEGVTETETEGWVCSDEMMVRSVMEGDGCPCFVSDAWGRVKWMNTAYRRMVMEEEEEEDVEVRVALAARGRIPACKAFSCRVSVRYAACGKRGRVTLAAPCDVMFLSDGGLAWRVDLKAALSLSLGR